VLLWRSRRTAAPVPPDAPVPVMAVAPGAGPDSDVMAGSDVRRLLEALPTAGVVVTRLARVVLASERATVLRLVRDDSLVREDLADLVRTVARDGRPRDVDVVMAARRRGALEQTLRVRVSPLTDDLLLLLAEDVSDARRVEAVRRDFVANVSHELKTPVGALTLLAEAAHEAADDPETVRRFADRMQGEARRLSRMVDDLLDLSRLQDDDPLSHATVVDVDMLIANAIEDTRVAAEQSAIALLAGGRTGLVLYGDESQLRTALRNLLVNAVAYSPPGTRVAVARRAAAGGAAVEISVTDQGLGIAESDQPRIFERFYRVDPARSRDTGGTGLGLAIVRRVCENHGGEVTVWSRLGEGATFTLRLPVHAEMLTAGELPKRTAANLTETVP
jgi:two-component system, OmpR family, sensor histidine kinase SenX3